jgi:acyl carrier protein
MSTEKEIKEIIAKQFNIDINKLTNETNFNKDLGADSLDTVEIVLAIEDKFNIEILDEHAEKILTIGDIVKYVDNLKA